MAIILKNASKYFKEHKALELITLKIGDGKTTVLIGPSGCGKPTILVCPTSEQKFAMRQQFHFFAFEI